MRAEIQTVQSRTNMFLQTENCSTSNFPMNVHRACISADALEPIKHFFLADTRHPKEQRRNLNKTSVGIFETQKVKCDFRPINNRLPERKHSLRRRANARNFSTSLLLYGGITYFTNSFDYPNLLYQEETSSRQTAASIFEANCMYIALLLPTKFLRAEKRKKTMGESFF